MSALTFTLEPRFYGEFTVDNLSSRQLCIVNGVFTYDAASSSALTVTVAMVGLNDIKGFIASPKGNVFWDYSPATATLRPVAGVFSSATGAAYLTASASFDVASITSIPFLCWGFR